MEIAGYTIEKLLGRGGMASVYLATQQSLRRPVALKVLNPLFSDTDTFSERFLNEGRMVAALSHPNIITIYDIGIHRDFHFISMEYLDDGDLRARIARGMSTTEALAVAEQVARCLELAHQKGIIHRDVKPTNILFRSDSSPVLTDFGIAKALHAASGLTVTGTVLGSPYYLSPEQAEGRNVDGRSDIYSLGIVICEMLTGTKPFQGNSDITTILKHLQDPVPVLPAKLGRFQPLMDAMLAKDAAARYPDMHTVVTVLVALRQGAPAVAHPTAARDAPTLTTRLRAEARGAAARPVVAHEATLRLPQELTRSLRQPRARTLGLASAAAIVVIGGLWLRSPGPDRTVPARVEASASLPQHVAAESPGPVPSAAPEMTDKQPSRPPVAETPTPGPEPLAFPKPMPGRPPVAVTATEPPMQPPAQTGSQDLPSAPAPPSIPVTAAKALSLAPLLTAGDTALADLRLTTPPDDNAYDYFRQALAIDPAQPQALAGLDRIADAYADLAEQRLAAGDRAQAQEYINRGLSVRPQHARLLALRDRRPGIRTTSQSPTLLDSVTNAIKRVGDDAKEIFTGRPEKRRGGVADQLMGE